MWQFYYFNAENVRHTRSLFAKIIHNLCKSQAVLRALPCLGHNTLLVKFQLALGEAAEKATHLTFSSRRSLSSVL